MAVRAVAAPAGALEEWAAALAPVAVAAVETGDEINEAMTIGDDGTMGMKRGYVV